MKKIVLLLLLSSCSYAADYPIPVKPIDTDQCGRMCTNLGELGCEEGKPVYNSDLPGPDGVPNQSCVEFCREMQDSGVWLNPKCVATVQECSQIETFRRKDPATCAP